MTEKTEHHRTYTKSDVEAALAVVTDVTLDRVYSALQDVTYGIIEKREISEDGSDSLKVKQVIDWEDVVKAINELRGNDE